MSNKNSDLTWCVRQRLRWIKETMRVFGFINREHITRKFDVSLQQASADLYLFQERWPGRILYNESRKRYELQQ